MRIAINKVSIIKGIFMRVGTVVNFQIIRGRNHIWTYSQWDLKIRSQLGYSRRCVRYGRKVSNESMTS